MLYSQVKHMHSAARVHQVTHGALTPSGISSYASSSVILEYAGTANHCIAHYTEPSFKNY